VTQDFKLKDARILIGEDDESNVLLLKLLLQNAGYQNVRALGDGRQILKELDDFQPDILLLDLNLTYMSGLEILEQLHARGGEGFLPVIVLSGDTAGHTRQRASMLGATDFLVKPYDINHLTRAIERQLRTRFDLHPTNLDD
jgi:DNA-binding response OmpR family regulator